MGVLCVSFFAVFELTCPTKELTESMACFNAIRNYLLLNKGPFDPKDEGVTALVIGDGSTPRTGALLALRTSWQVTSVDPAFTTKMKTREDGTVEYSWKDINRLTVIPKPIQEVKIKVREDNFPRLQCFDSALLSLFLSLDFQADCGDDALSR